MCSGQVPGDVLLCIDVALELPARLDAEIIRTHLEGPHFSRSCHILWLRAAWAFARTRTQSDITQCPGTHIDQGQCRWGHFSEIQIEPESTISDRFALHEINAVLRHLRNRGTKRATPPSHLGTR